jgi:hypothetical protein
MLSNLVYSTEIGTIKRLALIYTGFLIIFLHKLYSLNTKLLVVLRLRYRANRQETVSMVQNVSKKCLEIIVPFRNYLSEKMHIGSIWESKILGVVLR